jgi:DNA-binding PadR family transcriptional regulator
MMLQYILLGFLNYRSQTGYELKQLMDKSTSHFWYAKQSQIYTTLKKMEREGWITSRVEAQKGRPDRVVYKITKSGLKVLEGWVSNPIRELDLHKNALLVKLFFSAQAGREAVLTQLRLLRNLHQQKVQLYNSKTRNVIQEFVAKRPELKKDALLWEATRRFGELYEEMCMRWLHETVRIVEEKF